MADDALPPLPKPKYLDLIQPKPLNYQIVSDPRATDITSQDERDRSSSSSAPSSQNYVSGYQDRYQPAAGYSRLGRDIQTGQYVDVPQASRRQGLYMIGSPGTGKTGLIENQIIQDIKQGMGVGLLDPHGDLINAVLARMDRRVDDVILLDIGDEDYSFGLNLFACSNPKSAKAVQLIVDQVMHIFDKLFALSAATTPRLRQYLRNCTQTLIVNPGYTMADIPLLLLDEHYRKKLLANVMNTQVQGFWKTYNRMKPSEQLDHADSTLNKLDELLQPLTVNIVGQSTSTIDAQTIMDEGKILLVKLSAQLDSVTSLIGSVLIALFLNAAYARPANKRRQFNLYADEFQRFATEDFAILLTEARKFGIATTIAHQARYQPGMTDGIRATSLSAKNLVVFKVNSKDGDELAGEFDITPQEAWEEEIAKEWVEVLEEEWSEKVEDVVIDGEEPVQVYKREVIDHLLKQGHEDERVMQFVRSYLQPIIQDHTGKRGGYWLDDVEIDTTQAINDLNTWLFEGMRNAQMLFSELSEPIVGLASSLLSGRWFGDVYRFWYRKLYYSSLWWIDEIQFNHPIRYVNIDSEAIGHAADKVKKKFTLVNEQLRTEVLAHPPSTVHDFRTLRNRLFADFDYYHAYEDALQKRFGAMALHNALAELSGYDGGSGKLFFVLRGESRGELGSPRKLVTDLIRRQRLNVGDINQYYDMWVGLQSESAGSVPQHLTQTMRNISLGLGFLFNNQWAEMGKTGRAKQAAFQKRLQRWQGEYKGQLVLTHQEGLLLKDAAAAVNVAYDPGEPEDTPENVKKRTFVFADLAGMPPATATVVDAAK